MDSKQGAPDDRTSAIKDGLELLRAFCRIASSEGRRKVIRLAVALAPEEK